MASFLSFLLGEKTQTASVAKERLQIILAHERSSGSHQPDYLPALQRDLIAVISKYININPDDIKVNLERQDNLDVLEVKIELPDSKYIRLGQSLHGPAFSLGAGLSLAHAAQNLRVAGRYLAIKSS